MGCGGSKLDELEAVALCRSRCALLAEAIRHRYALADAHAAYSDSLRSVGVALHRILDEGYGAHQDRSPVLPLPGQRKGDPIPRPSPQPVQMPAPPSLPPEISTAHSHSRSHSGSHIHFHSDDSDLDGESPFHSDGDSPIHHLSDHHEAIGKPAYVNINYARSNPPPPSISFEQQLGSPEKVQYGSVSEPSSSNPYGYQYPTQNPNSFPSPFSYPYQPNYHGYGGVGGYFGFSSPPPAMSQSIPTGGGADTNALTSRAAPPPPSPPRTSTWDFLNPFEAFDSYIPAYTPSRSSREVREDEGIPDLEEDEIEVIKQAYGDQKFIPSTSTGTAPEPSNKGASLSKEDVGSPTESSSYHLKPKNEDNVVEKKVVPDKVQKPQESRRNFVAPRRYLNVADVASELRVQFEREAETTKELARMLEVGKQPYNRKGSVFAVSSKMMCVLSSAIPKNEDFVYEEDTVMCTGNISSTLQKLFIWEQKLLDEVRVEEKMRLLHDRYSKKLRHMDEKGAEAHKIDATQKLVRKLSTQIMIAIQVVNSISTKINVLRDQELWPQIDELIQGLERMWKAMLECHQIQCQAASEANYLDSIASGGKLSDSHLNALLHLQLELLRWIGNFSAWINSQKNFVKSLNSWLILCLRYEPEVTADGIPPYSPGRIGAPPAFVIFNCWFQSLDRVSEQDVLHAMHSFASSIQQLLQQNGVQTGQKMVGDREKERMDKKQERETQVINRELEALNRKLAIPSAQDDHPAEPGRLQPALRQVFEAMESFTANSIKVYEDIHARAEEEKAAASSQL